MIALPIVSLVALAAAVVAHRRRLPGARILLAGAIIMGLCSVGYRIATRRTLSPVQQALQDEEAAGRALAAHAAGQVAPGVVLVLRLPPLARVKNEITAVRFAGVQAALKDKPFQVIEAGPNWANLGTDDPDFALLAEDRFDEELRALLARHPDVKAIVSLLAVTPPLGGGVPPLYCFFAGREPTWINDLRRDRTRAVMLYRDKIAPDGAPSPSGVPGRFLLVTASNLNDVVAAQTH